LIPGFRTQAGRELLGARPDPSRKRGFSVVFGKLATDSLTHYQLPLRIGRSVNTEPRAGQIDVALGTTAIRVTFKPPAIVARRVTADPDHGDGRSCGPAAATAAAAGDRLHLA